MYRLKPLPLWSFGELRTSNSTRFYHDEWMQLNFAGPIASQVGASSPPRSSVEMLHRMSHRMSHRMPASQVAFQLLSALDDAAPEQHDQRHALAKFADALPAPGVTVWRPMQLRHI